MIKLHDVTFVMVETVCHDLARLAMEDCKSKIEFEDVLLLTDKPEHFDGISARVVTVPNWPTKLDWCRAIWFEVPKHIHTSHMLLCQWDAGIWNPDDWTNEFMKYDFIGALWEWQSFNRVCNTGFCLKSSRLARYIYYHRDKYPCYADTEDGLLCRKYRPDLEKEGFTWSPEKLAHKFSFEGYGPAQRPPLESHFGFHGLYNFKRVFEGGQLETRAKLISENVYLREKVQLLASDMERAI